MKDINNRQLVVILCTVMAPYVMLPILFLCYLSGWRFSDLNKD